MKRFQMSWGIIYTTGATREDAVWDLQLLLRGFLTRRRLWQRLIRIHSLRSRLRCTPLILCAHGKTRRGRWYLRDDNGRYQLLQDWIDEHDGESGSLLLFCCNSLNAEIASRRSLVVHLNRAASRWDLFRGGCLRLFHPEFGYIENNYFRIRRILGS